MSQTFRFLHITDRHCGAREHEIHWDQQKEIFFQDLKRCLRDQPLNAVFFTGDVANRAEPREYEEATENLKELYEHLASLPGQKKTPIYLIVVPGNHDVMRPPNPKRITAKEIKGSELIELKSAKDIEDDKKLRALIEEAQKLRGNRHVQFEFFRSTHVPLRRKVRDWFMNFSDWHKHIHENTGFSQPEIVSKPNNALPGEALYTIPFAPYQIGIVGLNSAFLHFYDCGQNEILITKRQIENVIKIDFDDWKKHHQIRILLTHHPIDWVHEQMKTQTITSKQFHIHLSGHVHEARASNVRRFGAQQEHYQIVGRSLISHRIYQDTEQSEDPSLYFGYILGIIHSQNVIRNQRIPSLKTKADAVQLQIMARRFHQAADGVALMGTDHTVETPENIEDAGAARATTTPHPISIDAFEQTVVCTLKNDEATGVCTLEFDRTIDGAVLKYEHGGIPKEYEIKSGQKHLIRHNELINYPQSIIGVLISYDDQRSKSSIYSNVSPATEPEVANSTNYGGSHGG